MVIDIFPAQGPLHPKRPDGKRRFPAHGVLELVDTLDFGLGSMPAMPQQFNKLSNQLGLSLRQIVHIYTFHGVSLGWYAGSMYGALAM
jgi:hypothetical protein